MRSGWRPLDRAPSIRAKLSVVVAGSVLLSAAVASVGLRLGWPAWLRLGISVAVGLGIMRLASAGITSPLREMARAARSMAAGEYSQRVRATSRDEVGELAVAFNHMSAELEQLDRQRRDLVANASHELRTPIAALQAMIENLADGVSEADPEFVETMHHQVRRLGTLVDQLLSLSRLDSGEMPLHLEPTSVATLINEATDELRWHHPEVEVAVSVAPETLMFTVDRSLVQRVISNLLENAVRHGAPPFAVCAEAHDAGTTVVIEVSDEGPGISASDADRVFDRFHRLDASRRSGGSGLGLAIVSGIVERHGGSVEVVANRSVGTALRVVLPRGAAAVESSAGNSAVRDRPQR